MVSRSSLPVDRSAPEASSLDRVALEMTSTLELDAVLASVTRGLVEDLGVALARVWLVEPGDAAMTLRASSGLSTRLDGAVRARALAARKIGRIAETRQAMWTNDVAHDERIADPAWARDNGLVSFAGWPLTFRGRSGGGAGHLLASGAERRRARPHGPLRSPGGDRHQERASLRRPSERSSGASRPRTTTFVARSPVATTTRSRDSPAATGSPRCSRRFDGWRRRRPPCCFTVRRERQGAHRARGSRAQPATSRPARQGQLRRALAGAGRE